MLDTSVGSCTPGHNDYASVLLIFIAGSVKSKREANIDPTNTPTQETETVSYPVPTDQQIAPAQTEPAHGYSLARDTKPPNVGLGIHLRRGPCDDDQLDSPSGSSKPEIDGGGKQGRQPPTDSDPVVFSSLPQSELVTIT